LSFQNLNLHFPDPDAFRAWLNNQPAPLWTPIGSTYHNTYSPDESQWRGHASMQSMATFYAAKGWTTGPHCYCASGTSADGIFVMCPPWLEGIHAGPCNSKRFGLEVVGNFQDRPMSHEQLVLLSETAAALHDWQQLGADIVAHRDCMPGRTCPGDSAYAQKADVQGLLAFALQRPAERRYAPTSPLIGTPPTPAIRWSGAKSAYDLVACRVITNAYWTQATAVGLDPILAFAQCLHETGNLTSWWCQRPRRNPAGIGVNGQTSSDPHTGDWAYNPADSLWHAGLSFPSWADDAIPQHLGRLLGYALKPDQMNETQLACYRRATARRLLPAAVLGCAPTLQGLEGTWAVPGTNYADAIAAIANRLVEAA
jgi:N-acetylmuramoyl-L-alanine amidase/Mannosyl-glycoprotein endo-beta-N-acetylglucosaminidase